MVLRFLTLIAIASFVCTAHAEYRVFVLDITDQTTGSSRQVIGTLDDLQYPGYHDVKQSERITIVDTWTCYKNQTENYRSYCPSPRAPASAMVK